MRDGPRRFTQDFSCPALLRILRTFFNKSYTGLSPSTVLLSGRFYFIASFASLQSYNPQTAFTARVWATARSLATTCAITFVFFSCRYLDVSVPRVCLPFREYQLHGGLPHSEIPDSIGYLHLVRAYRSLSRPSSPPRATGIHRLPFISCPLFPFTNPTLRTAK